MTNGTVKIINCLDAEFKLEPNTMYEYETIEINKNEPITSVSAILYHRKSGIAKIRMKNSRGGYLNSDMKVRVNKKHQQEGKEIKLTDQ